MVTRAFERVLETIQDRSYLDEKTGCFVWMGATGSNGHGVIRLDGKQQLIHRVIFNHLVKPTELDVLHKCDNPPCWNPEHLFDGTQHDNINDMVMKGRHCRGITQHRAKLTEDQVREIRKLTHLKYEEVGRMYDIDPSAIRKIILGITWKYVV